jgi:hypothetical protein
MALCQLSICKKDFTPRRSDQVFCSSRCATVSSLLKHYRDVSPGVAGISAKAFPAESEITYKPKVEAKPIPLWTEAQLEAVELNPENPERQRYVIGRPAMIAVLKKKGLVV